MHDDLDVIEPAGTPVQYGGKRLLIRPLVIGALPAFVRAVTPALPALVAVADGDDGRDELVTLVTEHGPAMQEALAIASGESVAFIRAGDLDGFVQLLQTVIEVNRDFFVRLLAPLLKARAASHPAVGAGPTQSTS